VLASLRPNQAPTPPPLLVVRAAPDRPSYPPGTAAQTIFTLTNQSGADLYVFQARVRPEWLPPNQWIPTSITKLLSPSASLPVRLIVPIPAEVELGEKELVFGIQGQWVGPKSASPSTEVTWMSPMIIRVQRPRTGVKVLLSHSVSEMSWVSRLETTLEDNGVATEVAPATAHAAPAHSVETADILVAVITDPARLEAALQEISHAKNASKQLVLLRDRSLAAVVPAAFAGLPWVDVDFSLGKATILMYPFGALNKAIEQPGLSLGSGTEK
jgi:hypothetical protein